MKKLAVISLQLVVLLVVCGQVWGAGVTDWWNLDYDFRKLLSCGNHDEYSTDHFLKIVGLDVTDGDRFLPNGDDVRIVYQETGESPVDLGRYIIDVNTDDASIYWQVQAVIPEDEDIGDPPGSDYAYYLYYGNDGAGSPPAYANTGCIDAPYSVDEYTVALYRFEEASGTIYDETANNNDGTVVGDPTYESTGKFGECLDYDGDDDYIWVNWYVEDPPAGALEISFWVYPRRDSQVILSFNELHPAGGTWDRGFAIDKGGAPGNSTIRCKVYDSQDYVAISESSLPMNTWSHVAGVIGGTGLILYINGTEEDVKSGCEGGYPGYATVEFLMGQSRESGWGLGYALLDYFDGKIDEVRVSDVTRTAFDHIDNEATISLGSEEEPLVRRRKILQLMEQ